MENDILQHEVRQAGQLKFTTGMDHVKTQITVTPFLACEASRVVAMTALCVSIQPYDSCVSLEQSNQICQWFL